MPENSETLLKMGPSYVLWHSGRGSWDQIDIRCSGINILSMGSRVNGRCSSPCGL